MKRLTIHHHHAASGIDDAPWRTLFAALRDTAEWALDRASELASPYPEEQDAVERVRAYFRARVAGRPAELVVHDVLLALGILIAAIDAPAREASAITEATFDRGAGTGAHRGPFGEWPLVRHCPGAQPPLTRRLPHFLVA
jgi:hypothetical protein